MSPWILAAWVSGAVSGAAVAWYFGRVRFKWQLTCALRQGTKQWDEWWRRHDL